MEKELEKRIELLGHYTKLKVKAQIEGQSTKYYDTCIEATQKQIHNILENELIDFFAIDIKNMPNEYKTVEQIKQFSAQKELENTIKDLGVLPIEKSRANISDKILVIDINYLPSDFKLINGTDDVREYLESIYGCKVLLVDTSRQNTQGNSYSKTPQPAYFI